MLVPSFDLKKKLMTSKKYSMRYFIAITDAAGVNIGGGSNRPGFTGWFSVSDFGFGGSFTDGSAAGGVGAGAVDFLPLQVSLANAFQTGSPQFLALMAGASGPTSVRLVGVDEARAGTPKTFEMQFSSALLTGYGTSRDGLTLSIEASQFSVQTFTPDAANKLYANDFLYNPDSIAPTPLAGGGSQPAVSAVTYYMAVSGLNGGSTAAGYSGWFALDSFDVAALRSIGVVSGGGLGVGKPNFDPLEATFRGDTGLTAFLALAASGGVISSIRIEGVRNGVATTRIDLGTVAVVGLNDSADGGFGVSLAFRKIGVTTIPPGGTATSTLYDVGGTALGGTPIPVAAPGPSGGTTQGANQFYATLSGIKGDITDAGRVGWFRVEAPFLELDRDYDPAAMNPGGTLGEARFSQIDLFFRSETAFTALFGAANSGSVLAGVTVQGVRASGVVYNLDLANARIMSFTDFGDGMRVSLSFDAFDLMTQQTLPNGGIATTVSGWNLVMDQPVTNVPSVNPGFATADPKVEPTKYFLVIDGVNGGSRAAGYSGWFELAGFNLEAGPGGPGVALTTMQQMGYAALLRAMVNGDIFSGARIEGVTSVGGVLKPVYQVDLGNVSLGRLQDDSNLGFSAVLEFDKIITRTLNAATGAVIGVSGWDTVTNTATTVPLTAAPTPAPVFGTVSTGLRYFIKMDGVGGDATQSGHLNWNEVDFSSDLEFVDGLKPSQGELNLSFMSMSAITQLMGQLTQRTTMTAVLEAVDSLGRVVSVLEMRGVNLTSLITNLEGSSGATLSYDAFELTTNRFNAANAVVGIDRFGYDFSVQGSTIVSTTAVAAAVLKLEPSAYYMAFDGLNGGVQTAQRGGWFAVSGIEFGGSVENDVTVSLFVSTWAGLTEVMARLASGAATGGVSIEGTTGTGGLERTVLDLSLGTVVVRDVQVNPEGGYKLTLSFGQMSLETWGNVPVGANTGLLQTQWNLETETNVLTGPILAAPGGTLGNDVLAGSAAADTLDGGAGNDALYGLAGNDALNGSNGADTLVGGAGNDVLAGGLGTGDYASYVGATGGVTVSLSVTTSQNTGGAGSDRLSGIEGLIGSGLGDTLTGDSLTNVIYGGDGIDQIIGLGGNDVLFGDAGNDSLLGGSGSDTISGGAGNDLFIFNATNEGVDVITDFDSSSTPGDTDGLRFAAAAFGGLPVGAILGTQFQSGPLPHALTSDVRFIYSTAAFGLFYDADGSGALFSPILLAQITTPILAGDIQIIRCGERIRRHRKALRKRRAP